MPRVRLTASTPSPNLRWILPQGAQRLRAWDSVKLFAPATAPSGPPVTREASVAAKPTSRASMGISVSAVAAAAPRVIVASIAAVASLIDFSPSSHPANEGGRGAVPDPTAARLALRRPDAVEGLRRSSSGTGREDRVEGICTPREFALLRYLDHVANRFFCDCGFPWIGSGPDTITPEMREAFGIAREDFALVPSLAARGFVEETTPGGWNATEAGAAVARFGTDLEARGAVH